MGWTIKNSAIAVGCSYPYAQKILSQYNQNGEKGVRNRKNQTSNHVRGKQRLLNNQQLEKLKQKIEQTAPDGGIWTGTKVARWIEKETGRQQVWNQRGWDYLKKCGYSWQSPRPTHKKADKLEQEIFKANLPLKIKKLEKKSPDSEIELWFFDEHRVGLKPILKKRMRPRADVRRKGTRTKQVWSKIGNRPEAIVQHRYEWLYVYGFVKPKTGETLWYLIPRVNTKWLNLVYEQFAIDAGVSNQKAVRPC